ncbi:MAG: division/cell wall cluster transcriptional repressor MraZ [Candidatus Brocadiaceae bacterium]|jgi:DNA-binding transcriptional regulator/RsmH inhibitor MraZ
MGVIGSPAGDSGNGRLVRLLGFREELSLDRRGRFRLPDSLADLLNQELGRVGQRAGALDQTSGVRRLSFYFVPGTRQRIFVYPVPNISLAVDRFENPPRGMDPDVIRRARDYFYDQMRFVEADKQHRLVIPDGLRQHAGIDEDVQQITLVAHNNWLALTRSELVEQRTAENLEAFQKAAPDLLNPAYPPRPPAPSETEDEQL